MIRATSNVKKTKEKYVHSGYGIVFDGKGEWSFKNGTTKNVLIFSFINRSSSHADNLTNNFLVLSEGDTFGSNESFDAPKKN